MSILLETLRAWISEYWAAIFLPFVGALHSHLKSYESKNTEQTWRWHVTSYFAKVIYAIVSVFITWNLCELGHAPTQVRLVIMAVMAIYPDFLLEYTRNAIKEFADRWKAKV